MATDEEILQYLSKGVPQAKNAVQTGGGGTSDEEILKYLIKGIPQPTAIAQTETSTSSLSPYFRVPAGIGSALAGGIATGLGLPGDLESLGVQYIANPVNNFLGRPAEDPNKTLFPTSAQLKAPLQNTGVIDNPLFAPQSKYEDVAQGIASGIGTMLPMGLGRAPITGLKYIGEKLAGAGPAALKTLENLLPGKVLVASGAASGGASSTAEMLHPGSGPIAGATAGFGTGILSEAAKAAQAARLIKGLGTSTTLQEGGLAAQDYGRGWLVNTLPANLAEAKAPLNVLVKEDLATPISNLENELKDITKSGGSLEEAVKLFRPQLPDRLKKILDYREFESGETPPIWKDVDSLQTEIGRAMSSSKIVSDTGEENLSRLYRAITKDKKAALEATGNPDALVEFNRWNETASKLLNFKDKVLSKIIGGKNPADDPAPELVANRFFAAGKKGGSDLEALREHIPNAVDELGSAFFKTEGNWKKLSPEAQTAFFPDAAERELVASHMEKPKIPGIAHGIGALALGPALGSAIGSSFGVPWNELAFPAELGAAGLAVAPYAWRYGTRAMSNPLLPAMGFDIGTQREMPVK